MASDFGDATFTFKIDPAFNFEMNDKVTTVMYFISELVISLNHYLSIANNIWVINCVIRN